MGAVLGGSGCSIRQRALKLLSQREHSRYELKRKLLKKNVDAEQVESVLDELSADQLQSDERFLNSYIHYRSESGYGPRRIAAELAERGIRQISPLLMNENDAAWKAKLETVWRKKFNREQPRDAKAKAQQIRFLIYRGFNPEQVYEFLGEL
jgi:regulatory protein